ncbi:hypothetical protein EDM53_00860 [Rickettsiales endosymbiont of Peranema trichophorum]|uniref:hypothetical protein n=1 Tax=Rickettsiales endosymbiont of Peranema trichophorum TaxID=2486577 RepID=UPI0010233138|nr:hypothetical protein [Rickettsiales endosymbiont of Peranema trichophorum]RZI47635.1 hypothetical protein EDM53_00860 [Rickettsiales endosymbiont of Peranema trichophorum]
MVEERSGMVEERSGMVEERSGKGGGAGMRKSGACDVCLNTIQTHQHTSYLQTSSYTKFQIKSGKWV